MKINEKNYSNQIHNVEATKAALGCLLETKKKLTLINSANWKRMSKSQELRSVYWMMILENGCHILTQMGMFLAKYNLIQINDYNFPLDKHGRKLYFIFYRQFLLEQL